MDDVNYIKYILNKYIEFENGKARSNFITRYKNDLKKPKQSFTTQLTTALLKCSKETNQQVQVQQPNDDYLKLLLEIENLKNEIVELKQKNQHQDVKPIEVNQVEVNQVEVKQPLQITNFKYVAPKRIETNNTCKPITFTKNDLKLFDDLLTSDKPIKSNIEVIVEDKMVENQSVTEIVENNVKKHIENKINGVEDVDDGCYIENGKTVITSIKHSAIPTFIKRMRATQNRIDKEIKCCKLEGKSKLHIKHWLEQNTKKMVIDGYKEICKSFNYKLDTPLYKNIVERMIDMIEENSYKFLENY